MKTSLLQILSAVSLAVMGCGSMLAVKAKPGVVKYTQPDGSVIEIMLQGDERRHYATNLKGDVLKANEKGFYEVVAANAGTRGAEVPLDAVEGRGEPKYRYSASAFPTTGEPHSLVILVEYPDHGFNVQNPLEYFEDFLNGDNFTRDGGTGSCRKFYIENSNGAFQPTFDVYGPVMLANKRSYYGSGDESNAPQMVVEAVKALDDEVDFSVYDHNGDGFVDSVYIIYSDKGEADGGPRDTVWPFSWELLEDDIVLKADGVQFNTYGCSNELQSDGDMEGIGTFTHEFGHVLGLPDLYNTYNSRDYTTPLDWSIMDNASYNNDSRTPCNFSSFERYSLGWLVPQEIVSSADYTLETLPESNKAYLMTTDSNPDEFYIMEYRLPKGWDEYLPTGGFLVWHVEFKQKAWDDNTVNNNPTHQYVELVRADNMANTLTLTGDPFPGSFNIIEFSTDTKPALKSWAGDELRVTSLSNFRQHTDGTGSFTATCRATEDNGIDMVEGENNFSVEGNIVSVTSGRVAVANLAGCTVGEASPSNPLRLPPGIFIISGKKIIVK